MKTKAPWWQWPKNKKPHYFPAYIMAWMILWTLPLYVALRICWLLILIRNGHQDAEQFFGMMRHD